MPLVSSGFAYFNPLLSSLKADFQKQMTRLSLAVNSGGKKALAPCPT